jgi:hypothetical protein
MNFSYLDNYEKNKIYKVLHRSLFKPVMTELSNFKKQIVMKHYECELKKYNHYKDNKYSFSHIEDEPKLEYYLKENIQDETIYEVQLEHGRFKREIYFWFNNGAHSHFNTTYKTVSKEYVFYDLQRMKTIEAYEIRNNIPTNNY